MHVITCPWFETMLAKWVSEWCRWYRNIWNVRMYNTSPKSCTWLDVCFVLLWFGTGVCACTHARTLARTHAHTSSGHARHFNGFMASVPLKHLCYDTWITFNCIWYVNWINIKNMMIETRFIRLGRREILRTNDKILIRRTLHVHLCSPYGWI